LSFCAFVLSSLAISLTNRNHNHHLFLPPSSMFPGKSSLPSGCLWSLRVWLRVNSVDHRLFGEDEVWVGKDPDFNAIGDASFARLKHQNGSSGNGGEGEMVYQLYVGRAPVSFGVK
jgi:hypothetical protein